MIDAILNYRFMQNALYAALLASVVTGIIGTIAIEKKLISMSGGIAHASFGGIGLGYLLGFEPIWGGLLFAVASSVMISRLPRSSRMKADTMIGILWSFGMALGILFITLAPGYMPDMTSYLFGDILSVSSGFIVYIAIFTVVVVALFTMLYHPLVLYLFDEEYATARGMNVKLLEWVVYHPADRDYRTGKGRGNYPHHRADDHSRIDRQAVFQLHRQGSRIFHADQLSVLFGRPCGCVLCQYSVRRLYRYHQYGCVSAADFYPQRNSKAPPSAEGAFPISARA